MKIEEWKTADIIPYENNPRINDMAVDKVAMSLEQYGWQQPIVVDGDGVTVCGHTRLKAAIKLGMETCPVVVADQLTPEQVKAYRIADNRTGELADWNYDLLNLEIKELKDLDFDIELTGFLEEEFEEKQIKDKEVELDNEYTDKNCELPIVPDFFEKHQCFLIVTHNEIDENFIREYFDLNQNYISSSGDTKERKTNIIDIEAVRAKCLSA